MSNNQEVITNNTSDKDTQKVKIDLEINNTSSVMLNLELLNKMIDDDSIGVIVSFLIVKRPIEVLQHSTALLYHSILDRTVEEGEQFEVGKIYLCPMYRYVGRWATRAICFAFKVEKITNCYITVRQITTEPNYALNNLPIKKLLKTNVNNGSRYFDIKKRQFILDFIKHYSFEATISTDNCYSFDKESHFRYMLNFSAKFSGKKGLIVGKYWNLVDFQKKNKEDEIIIASWY